MLSNADFSFLFFSLSLAAFCLPLHIVLRDRSLEYLTILYTATTAATAATEFLLFVRFAMMRFGWKLSINKKNNKNFLLYFDFE